MPNPYASLVGYYAAAREVAITAISRVLNQHYSMKCTNSGNSVYASSYSGLAVTEVIMSMGVAAVAIGCIISGYLLAIRAAELSASSAAVQSSVIQSLEQTRSARWEPMAGTPIDELVESNFPPSVTLLDIPLNKKKVAYATNRTTITTLTGYPMLKMIRVESTWASLRRGPFTNSVTTYRSASR